MIAFNNSNDEEDKLNKLQDILNFIHPKDNLFEEVDTKSELDDTNISELIELVYFHLFLENQSEIDLSIKRKSNNALNIKITHLK